MSENVEIPELERITFFKGQQLTAADLTDLQQFNREMRWLHNRGQHQWGIGYGFDVNGDRGSRVVTVLPGYGIDNLGREVILTEPQTKPVPAIAGGGDRSEVVYFLVAAYQSDEDQHVAERRSGVCLPGGTVRLSEEPLIDWRLPNQLNEGFELILAKAWVKNCQLSRPLSLAMRRSARPSEQPYIAAGQTEVGNTEWEAWSVNGQMIGLQTQVNTSAARFRTTPRYLAHVAGERYLAEDPGPLIALGFPSVVDATSKGFLLQVMLPAIAAGSPSINPAKLRDAGEGPQIFNKLESHVVWMGVEG